MFLTHPTPAAFKGYGESRDSGVEHLELCGLALPGEGRKTLGCASCASSPMK
jgi:hypothetical protein